MALAEQEKNAAQNAAQVEKVEAELKVVKDQNAMLVDKVDKVEAHLHLTDLHLKADKGELARLNAVVDDMTAAINDMTEANGDRDDKVRRIEKVTGIIQGVLTQRAVEYTRPTTARTRVVFSRGSKSEVSEAQGPAQSPDASMPVRVTVSPPSLKKGRLQVKN